MFANPIIFYYKVGVDVMSIEHKYGKMSEMIEILMKTKG